MLLANLYHPGKVLKESPVSYSFFVRAWYSDDTYADFTTNGISALSTKLARRQIKGAAVSIQSDVFYLIPSLHVTIIETLMST